MIRGDDQRTPDRDFAAVAEQLIASRLASGSDDITYDSTAYIRSERTGEPNCGTIAGSYPSPSITAADRDDVLALAIRMAFGKALVTNSFRSVVVEAVVRIALGDTWTWSGGDWAAFDFRHADGVRLEVKQSAAAQSWASSRSPKPRFDIAPRSGRWEGDIWTAEPGRNADLYLFAYHPLTDDHADHRDPRQWLFYLVPAVGLPPTKSVGLKAIAALVPVLTAEEVGPAVETARLAFGQAGVSSC